MSMNSVHRPQILPTLKAVGDYNLVFASYLDLRISSSLTLDEPPTAAIHAAKMVLLADQQPGDNLQFREHSNSVSK